MWCISVNIMVISVRQKNVIYYQPFLKMRKFLLNTRKDFLIMSNFYLVEILNEPNSLTIVTSKQILKVSNYVLILIIFFLKMRIRNLQCTYLISTKSLQITSWGRSSRSQIFFKVWRSVTLLKRVTGVSSTGVTCEYCKTFKNSFFIEHLWWLLLKRGYWTLPKGFCILRNVNGFFYSGKCISTCNPSTWAYFMSNASSLYVNQLTEKEAIFNDLSKLIELKLISSAWP